MVKLAFKYFGMKKKVLLQKLEKKKKAADDYYKSDIAGVQEQAFYMLRTRVGAIVEEVSYQKKLKMKIIEDQSIDLTIDRPDSSSTEDNVKRLADILDFVIGEIEHLTEMRETDNFDNPFVLSFLSHYIIPNHFIPDNYLFKMEIRRIKFASTGLTSHDLPSKVSEMLAASFLIIRTFCDKMLLNADILMVKSGRRFGKRAYDNLRVIVGIFYHTFLDLYKDLLMYDDNLSVIEMTPRPSMRYRAILFGKNFKK